MPISLLAAASTMENVKIFDERVSPIAELTDSLNDTEYLMFSVFTGYSLKRAYEMSKMAKEIKPDIKIVWGGPHPTALPEQTLESEYVDAVIVGDTDKGEKPLPYWLIDIEKYINPATKRFIYVSSYGCPGSCSFCALKKRRKFQLMPLERVKGDIDYLMFEYRFKECVFFDATLFTVRARVEYISEYMQTYDLKWIADARAVDIMKYDSLYFKGLKQLTIGLESGSQRIIDLMKKGARHLEYYKQAAVKLSDYPIKMVSGVVLGCPGETVEDLKQTIEYIEMIKQINPNFRMSTTFYKPLPGTEMSDMSAEYGYKEPENLEEWAKVGEGSHYNYNEWNDVPWIIEPDKYRLVYDEFKKSNKELFI